MPSSTTSLILARVSLTFSSEQNEAYQVRIVLHPQEGADISHLGGSSSQSWVTDSRRS
jgi:hypothetical protein